MSDAAASSRVTEALWDSGRTQVRRTIDRAGRAVVLKTFVDRRPHPKEVARFENEFRIASSLDTPAVVRPLALEQHEGGPVLVLEDFGGAGLDRLLDAGTPWPPGRFLTLAVAAAGALAEVHRRGVIHKNIKPANLLVNEATAEVKITGFGIASGLPREQQMARNPALIEGTLAYMSPEQTGRMNRAMDQRTDLYSLGITFYQLLTGRLPFNTGDPLEWVHCQIARVPPAPTELVPGLPEMLSRVVTKLLAKAAEDRYQSAAGLKHDLEACLRRWQAAARIELFPLAERDASDRLQLPQKLHGRQAELALLLASFGRVVASGLPELVLVSGYSGVGKSSLVHELEKPVVRERGVFLAGKFDQYKRNIPYSTIVHAFRGLILDLLTESDERIAVWKERLGRALGDNGQLIVDLVPELELIIGKPPAVAELGPTEAQIRFGRVFQSFIRAFAASDRPVVLFLDDLQWVDAGSLRLLAQTLTNRETRHLLVIGAFRDNEVSRSHPLHETLARIREARAPVHDVVLAPLSAADVAALVSDALRCPPAEAEPLAALLAQKTGGNPFFAIQFLTTLYEEGLLSFDHVAGRWCWDVDRITAKGYTSNIVEFMVAMVEKLPAEARRALEIAACLGTTVDARTLAAVADRSLAELRQDLLEGVREGLLVPVGDEYRFVHDRVRQAAYELIGERERAATHLRIGRWLLARTPPQKREEVVFDIVDQLNRAALLVTDEAERTELAALNLSAGKRAKASHAPVSALSYFSAGLGLLGPDAWDHQYDLTYAMTLGSAECELLRGSPQAAVGLATAVLAKARTMIERAPAYSVKLDAELASGAVSQAVATELQCLASLGIELPPSPTWAEVLAERDRIRRFLGDRPIEALLDLPPMASAELRAALLLGSNASYFTDPKLWALRVARTTALCLEHGNADASVLWYGTYGWLVAMHLHAFDEGYRFAKAAYDLMERRRALAHEASAHFFLALTAVWTEPLDQVIGRFEAGFRAGVETDDIMRACHCTGHWLVGKLARGQPLEQLARDMDAGLEFLRQAGYGDMSDGVLLMRQFVRALAGRTGALSTLADPDFDEAGFEARLTDRSNSMVRSRFWVSRLWLSFLSGDHARALEAAEKAAGVVPTASSTFLTRDFHLYRALTLAALYPGASAEQRRKWRSLLEEDETRLGRWASALPATFGHGHALVSAAIAQIDGRERDAARLYEESLEGARAGKFIQDEALAYELGAGFYRSLGAKAVAEGLLREAHSCYLRWGAAGKVKQLERLHPQLARAARPFLPTSTFIARPEQIDLLSVVKVSQALSGEVILERLLRTLMEAVLAQSGAEKGALILPRDGTLSIEAEAVTNAHGAEVRALEGLPVLSSASVPGAILQYVWRTGETVVLDDAARGHRFSADGYFAQAHPRSVLCMPVRRHAEVVGLLYVENKALPGVFTPERLSVLELLAAQAAISLENARFMAHEHAARAAAEEAERRAALLAETSSLVGESLDYAVVLPRLAELMVHTIADWCVVDVVEEGEIRRMAQVHRDPAKQPLIDGLKERYPPGWGSPHPAARVLATGQPMLAPELTDELTREIAVDEEHRRLGLALADRTGMAVPLLACGRVLGAITLGSAQPGRRFGQKDLELCQELARRVALAIDNAQLYRRSEEAVRMRDEFLSVASHELNTPLTAVTLGVRALREKGPEEGPRLAALLERQTERLARLVDQLLDVTRMAHRRLTLDLENVDLTALVREVVAQFALELERARCEVSLVVEDQEAVGGPGGPGGRIIGRWDRTRIEQVVMNLLSNAAKFGAGKPIEIQLQHGGDRARLRVTDHGIGIAPARRSSLFDRFGRGVAAEYYGGLGLGLYISRQIVDAHGGSIWVESRPGQGATFVVELPRAGPSEKRLSAEAGQAH